MFLVCFFSIQLTYKDNYIHISYIVNTFVDFLYAFFFVFLERLIQVDLYEKIKLLASEKKMSIRQLEETLGFGNGVINRWRKNTPGSDKLKKVADYFDVSVDYLLGRTENPNTVENENANISPEFFAIQRKSKKLSQKEQQKLLKLMELTFEEIDNGDFEEDDDDDL